MSISGGACLLPCSWPAGENWCVGTVHPPGRFNPNIRNGKK